MTQSDDEKSSIQAFSESGGKVRRRKRKNVKTASELSAMSSTVYRVKV